VHKRRAAAISLKNNEFREAGNQGGTESGDGGARQIVIITPDQAQSPVIVLAHCKTPCFSCPMHRAHQLDIGPLSRF
jgi:hypothetical protein